MKVHVILKKPVADLAARWDDIVEKIKKKGFRPQKFRQKYGMISGELEPDQMEGVKAVAEVENVVIDKEQRAVSEDAGA